MTPPRNHRRVVAVSSLLVVLVITAVALALFARRGSGENPEAARPAAAARTLVVFRDGEPSPSVTPITLRVQLISGALEGADATVLTDEDCAADDVGISHCRNRLRLGNGTEIVVRHPHDMMKIPCLKPGEPVRLAVA